MEVKEISWGAASLFANLAVLAHTTAQGWLWTSWVSSSGCWAPSAPAVGWAEGSLEQGEPGHSWVPEQPWLLVSSLQWGVVWGAAMGPERPPGKGRSGGKGAAHRECLVFGSGAVCDFKVYLQWTILGTALLVFASSWLLGCVFWAFGSCLAPSWTLCGYCSSW